MSRAWTKWIGPVITAGAIIASGCASNKTHDEHVIHLTNGDFQEKTASVQTLPTFLNGKSKKIADTYKLAAENADLLQWIPCFCGCGVSASHKNNQNCFIKSIESDGTVVWDDHGTRCDVCMNIANQAVQMKKDGKSVKEIRAAIDQAYSKGYAPPTKTALPL